MGKEIEVKVLNIDLEQVENKLINMGAKLIAEEYQINTIIDSKDKYIQKSLNSYLRIRETKDLINNKKSINLTLKKNISKEEVRKNIEITVEIDDKDAMISILKDLGFDVVEEGFKERKSYFYDGIHFDLDKWDEKTYPYPYMEIEVDEKEDLQRAIQMLDIDRENISTQSITELKEELERSRRL